MELLPATQIAEAIIEKLAPYCKIINIAGSIRRQKTEVKDIELVVLPKKEVVAATLDMFSEQVATEQNSKEFGLAVKQLGTIHKGTYTGKYMKIELIQGIMLDLFIPMGFDYYRQYAIRTGSADYSYKIIATGWKKKGWVGTDSGLRKIRDCDKIISAAGKVSYKCVVANPELPPCWESEASFFSWLGVDYLPPTERNL